MVQEEKIIDSPKAGATKIQAFFLGETSNLMPRKLIENLLCGSKRPV
jgi:hypothetical protein